MDFLKDHEMIIEMLRLMEENNRQDQAQEFSRLIACVDSMEQQYAAVLSELRDVKQQLAEMPEQRRSVKDALMEMVQTLEDRVGEMREQLQTIRDKIISCAKDAVSGFKQMGVSALDTAVCALGIKNLLESVQDKINEAASLRSVGRQEPTAKLFTGKLVCADCKTPLSANAETQHRKNGTKKRYISYFCGTYGKSGRSVCSWHRIYEQTLTQIVIAEIRSQAQAVTVNEAAVVDKLKRKIADYDGQRLANAQQEISKLRRRVQELETMTAKLYEDKYSGAVSESTFMVLTQKNEQERLAKAERLDALLSEVDKAQQKTAAIHNWTAIIRKYLNLQELDRATIDELIDHIEVGERTVVDGQRRQDIKVFYRFVGLVE